MISARRVIRNAFITSPKLVGESPDKILRFLNENLQLQVTLPNDELVNFQPTYCYHQSNIKGYYFLFECDSCGNGCLKAYVKSMNTYDGYITKLLCGRCAGIKYKRKSIHEKRALKIALNPERMNAMIMSGNVNSQLMGLTAAYFRDEIREKAHKMWDKLGNKNPEITE
jgi:hypothetical protein